MWKGTRLELHLRPPQAPLIHHQEFQSSNTQWRDPGYDMTPAWPPPPDHAENPFLRCLKLRFRTHRLPGASARVRWKSRKAEGAKPPVSWAAEGLEGPQEPPRGWRGLGGAVRSWRWFGRFLSSRRSLMIIRLAESCPSGPVLSCQRRRLIPCLQLLLAPKRWLWGRLLLRLYLRVGFLDKASFYLHHLIWNWYKKRCLIKIHKSYPKLLDYLLILPHPLDFLHSITPLISPYISRSQTS